MEFLFLFVLVFISWLNPTILKNIHEKEDTFFKLATQGQMLFALLMGVFIADAFNGGSIGFAVGYIGVRLIHLVLQERMYRTRADLPRGRRNAFKGYVISVLLWTVSLFVPPPFRFVLWGMGLALDILAPFAKSRRPEADNRIIMLDRHHLPERLGLFAILVMGESVIVLALVNNLSNGTPFTWVTGVVGAVGFIMMAALWWLYFQYMENYVVGTKSWSLPLFLCSHVSLYAGIIMLLACL